MGWILEHPFPKSYAEDLGQHSLKNNSFPQLQLQKLFGLKADK